MKKTEFISKVDEDLKLAKEFQNKVGSEYIIVQSFFQLYTDLINLFNDYFEDYCIGKSNEDGTFTPSRKLNFIDLNQLRKIFNHNDSFIEYDKIIPDTHQHIFNEPDPFNFYSTGDYSSKLKEMKIIRNFIAHKSDKSKKAFKDLLKSSSYLNVDNIELDITDVANFLGKQLKKSRMTRYEDYLNWMKKCVIYLDSPF